jgi:vitamin B12 transporter
MDSTHAGGICRALLLLLLPIPGAGQIRPVQLEGFIVTGTPVPRSVGTVSSHVTLLEGEDLRARGVSRVVDALVEVPGLVVVQGGSFGSTTSTFFRGAESDHVKVLVDGVEMNQAGGAFDFSGLLVSDVERIEVVRGAASAFYGSDAMAGVIHIITRRGDGPLKGSLSASGGSFGRMMWNADARGRWSAVGYSFSLSREKTDGILDFNNEFDNTVFSGKVFLTPDSKTRVELSGRYGDRTYHYPTDGSGNVVDRNAFTFGEEKGLTAEVGHLIGSNLEVLATYRRYQWDGGSDDRSDGPADTLGFYGYVSDDSFHRNSGDVRLNMVPWSDAVLSLGVEIEDEDQRSESESFSQWGPSGGKDRHQRETKSFYGHLVAEGDGLSGNLGARFEDNDQYGEFFTYQAGLSYSIPSSGTLFRTSLGKGMKEPTFFETASSGFSLGNPDLEPERSQVWEVGVEQSVGASGMSASLTWFRQTLANLIQYTSMPPEPGAPNYYNVAEARAQGLEATATVPVGKLVLSGAYTYLDSEVLDAGFDQGEGATFVEGGPLIRRPTHQGSVNAAYQFDRWALNGTARRTGSRSDRDFSGWPAGPVELPAYTVLSLGAQVNLFDPVDGRPGASLQLRGENLLAEEYQETFGFMAPGRALLVGLRMTFGG